MLLNNLQELLRIDLPHSPLCDLLPTSLPPFPDLIVFLSTAFAGGLFVPQLQQQCELVFRQVEGREVQTGQVELAQVQVEDFVRALLSGIELGGGSGGCVLATALRSSWASGRRAWLTSLANQPGWFGWPTTEAQTCDWSASLERVGEGENVPRGPSRILSVGSSLALAVSALFSCSARVLLTAA